MIIRSLDSDGDWNFGHGLSDYLAGQDAIGLNIKTRILSWVGDCFFDTQAGIDWVNILGEKNTYDTLNLSLRKIILTSFGVTGITSLTAYLVDRVFSGTYYVNTIFSNDYTNQITQEFQ